MPKQAELGTKSRICVPGLKKISALICFGQHLGANWKICEVFTGSSVFSTYSTSYSHKYSALGFYNRQPITVGSENSDGQRKVETLSSTGWTSLDDSPMNYLAPILIGLGNDLLMIGGKDQDGVDAYSSSIWRLSNNNWSQGDDLKKKVGWGSAIATGKSIFIVGGIESTSHGLSLSQRIDLEENDEIAGVEQIGELGGRYFWPALFATSPDYCNSDL
ncbi:unnamed protein product [Oikopleura dioica]|uniref:Uncharacterized protein n=1 Tax=Oikopleura dioica TaxID=34765 RepID=E4XS98_OIKDI|nr:unnamed protein product [Oikopleura dioica]